MLNFKVPSLLFVVVLIALPSVGIQKPDATKSDMGDGGLATKASINGPSGVAVDQEGNLFIADREHFCVRRVDAKSGIITTVAGNGINAFTGEGGPATLASLAYPTEVAVDGAGNLFIADFSANRILRVDKVTGILTTVAGTGKSGYSGDDGPATEASLNAPEAITVDDAGDLYIADRNHRIRKVAARTGIITTVVGARSGGGGGNSGLAIVADLNFPQGLAFDATGNLFIADYQNCRIARVDARTKIITTIAGNGQEGSTGDGGLAIKARVNYPSDLAVDAVGNVYFVEGAKDRIRKIDMKTGIISTVAGSGERGFSGDGGLAIHARLHNPSGLAIDKAGNLFISEYVNNRVRRVDAKTGVITTVAGNGLPHRNDVQL